MIYFYIQNMDQVYEIVLERLKCFYASDQSELFLNRNCIRYIYVLNSLQ